MHFSGIHLGAVAIISLALGFGAGSVVDMSSEASDRLEGVDVSTRVTDPASQFLIDVIEGVQSGESRTFTVQNSGIPTRADAKVLLHAASQPLNPKAGCSGQMKSTERLSYGPTVPVSTKPETEPTKDIAPGSYYSELLVELDNCFVVIDGGFDVDESGKPTLTNFRVNSSGETREDAVRRTIGSTSWREAQAKLRLRDK